MRREEISELLATKLQVYVNNPAKRCKFNNSCKYSGKTLGIDTEGCLIGSLLSEEDRLKADMCNIGGVDELMEMSGKLGINLPDWFKYNDHLLTYFQGLHDADYHWSETGLSNKGKTRLDYLIEKFKLVEEPFKEMLSQ